MEFLRIYSVCKTWQTVNIVLYLISLLRMTMNHAHAIFPATSGTIRSQARLPTRLRTYPLHSTSSPKLRKLISMISVRKKLLLSYLVTVKIYIVYITGQHEYCEHYDMLSPLKLKDYLDEQPSWSAHVLHTCISRRK